MKQHFLAQLTNNPTLLTAENVDSMNKWREEEGYPNPISHDRIGHFMVYYYLYNNGKMDLAAVWDDEIDTLPTDLEFRRMAGAQEHIPVFALPQLPRAIPPALRTKNV